jgi:hypothetical protein
VTYTWQVEYARSFDQQRTIHQEQFESTTLVNRNGVQPQGSVTGPDDDGLWWPALPPRPTADELEARKREPIEQRTDPLLQKDVKYAITFDYDGQRRTLPTNRSVYREAAEPTPISRPWNLPTAQRSGALGRPAGSPASIGKAGSVSSQTLTRLLVQINHLRPHGNAKLAVDILA